MLETSKVLVADNYTRNDRAFVLDYREATERYLKLERMPHWISPLENEIWRCTIDIKYPFFNGSYICT